MNWSEYVVTIKNAEKRKLLFEYGRKLETQGFPVIFDFEHLAYEIGIVPNVLASILTNPSKHYRTFEIPKRSSKGTRTINSPYPTLKLVQAWIKSNILEKIEVSESCFSYKKGRSVIDNANVHLGRTVLYKIDLKDFFPSINLKRVLKVFQVCGYTSNVSYYLAAFCTSNDELPQGAPSSPSLSNIIGKRLDIRIENLSAKHNLLYSRYADDISISGDFVSNTFISYIHRIIVSEGFKVNYDKEILIIGTNKKKLITGVSVSTNDRLTVTRQYKRDVKQMVYELIRNNNKIDPSLNDFDPLYPDEVLGKLRYWQQVEKYNAIPSVLISRLNNKLKEFEQIVYSSWLNNNEL